MRLGVMTGGGDCPGLNAVLRGLVRRGVLELGYEFVGLLNGYEGLVQPGLARPLDLEDVRGLLGRGGTILGTSNKANPFKYAVREGDRWVEQDMSRAARARYDELGLDGVVVIGGDGTLQIAHRLMQETGIRVVGVPKTIDNDLSGTDQTFGFDTALGVISEAFDRLHTTAEAHERVMILEIMGRDAGFLTLDGSIAGGADVILLPELPYRLDSVLAKLRQRYAQGRRFSIVGISEGARPVGGEQALQARASDIPGRGVVRLGGSGKVLADLLAPHLDAEIRVTVLGHLQRGGTPSALDRVLATMYGTRVLDLVRDGQWNHMVCLRGATLAVSSMAEARTAKKVDLQGDKVRMARAMGISFGDEPVQG